METRTISATTLSLLLPVFMLLVMIVCLQIGGITSIIAVSIWLLIFILATVSLISTAIDPKNKSIELGITVDENGKRQPSPTAWDKYMVSYENRWKSPLFWLSQLIQLAWLAAFLHYGYLYAAIILVTSAALAEAARWRIYKCIKKNKLGWGAAGFIIGMQDFMKDISKETKSINGEE